MGKETVLLINFSILLLMRPSPFALLSFSIFKISTTSDLCKIYITSKFGKSILAPSIVEVKAKYKFSSSAFPKSENARVLSCFYSLFVCFVALRPKSTAMVIAGQSVHLITLFPGQA